MGDQTTLPRAHGLGTFLPTDRHVQGAAVAQNAIE